MHLAIVICLFALTGTAFSTATYGSPYGNMLPQPAAPRVSGGYGQEFTAHERLAPQPMEPQPIVGSFIKHEIQAPVQQSYGAPLTVPKTLPTETYAAAPATYGSAPYAPQTEQRTLIPILSEADILCKGHLAETIIPVDNSRKFVVCIDDGKGTIQECPKGLFFHRVSLRCERTLGALEDACVSQPCLNGGQCITAGSSYQCQCTPGYDGVNCELDARVCQTQQPCGAYAKCQSFRTGAALSHICIFQDGLAYGLNAQQTFQSPCSTVSGPYALAASNLGFLMCDGERMFIESCPGGTVWDDAEKACSWPDLQIAADYAPQGYGSSYAPAPVAPKVFDSYAPAPVAPKVFDSYAPAPVVPKVFDSYAPAPVAPKLVQSYVPAPVAPKVFDSYAPAPIAPKAFDSYAPAPVAPKLVQSYAPAPVAPKVFDSYAAAPVAPKAFDSYAPAPVAPKLVQSYAPAPVVPKFVQSYAPAPVAPKVFDSYAPAPLVPKVVQPYAPAMPVAQSYRAQISTPRQLLSKILTKHAPSY